MQNFDFESIIEKGMFKNTMPKTFFKFQFLILWKTNFLNQKRQKVKSAIFKKKLKKFNKFNLFFKSHLSFATKPTENAAGCKINKIRSNFESPSELFAPVCAFLIEKQLKANFVKFSVKLTNIRQKSENFIWKQFKKQYSKSNFKTKCAKISM